MNRFRYEALVDEFPFLSEVWFSFFEDPNDSIRNCEYIVIKQLNEVLYMTPRHETIRGSMTNINDEQVVHFILDNLDDRSIIRDAVKKERKHTSDNTWFENPGETILEAAHRHGVADRIKYIVVTHIGYNIVEYRSTDKWNATVYKLPKHTTISAEIEKAKKNAREKVRAEANF